MFIKTLFICLTTATALVASPQAVVFDFGGVITKEPNREAVIDFLRNTFDLSEHEFQNAYAEKRARTKDGMTDAEFWIDFAKTSHITLPNNWKDQFMAVMKSALNVNLEMIALVDELKQNNIKVALFSNIDKRRARLIREFGLYKPFHPCILSCDIGFEKPCRQAYEVMLGALRLPAENVIFIDDRLENVEAAKNLDIDAILFNSTKQIKQELKRRGMLCDDFKYSSSLAN